MVRGDDPQPFPRPFREDEYLLREDPRVSKEALYYSILGAVAAGKTSQREITGVLGRKSVDLGYPLGVLVSAGFITREEDLLVAQNPVFRVADPIVRSTSWSPAVTRQRSKTGTPRRVWDEAQPTFRSQIVGPHFEAICRAWVSRYATNDTLGRPIGEVHALRINDPTAKQSYELDVVAATAESSGRRNKTLQVLGEAKGTTAPRTIVDLQRLDHIHRLLAARKGVSVSRSVKKLLFGLSGFGSDLVEAATGRDDVELIDIDRLYEGQ